MDGILVLNAGSSSIKFAVFDAATAADGPQQVFSGHVAQEAAHIELAVKGADGAVLERQQKPSGNSSFDHDEAIISILAWLGAHQDNWVPVAVGHRVVHGGETYAAPVAVTQQVLSDLEALVPLAPLHQAHNLKPIRLISKRWPGIPQVLCFDTAFHRTQSSTARAFALPRELTEAGVQRYGFHGLSYEYIASQLPRVLGEGAGGKIMVAHLGSGASLCAMQNGCSVATTMGFSALDGLVMGSRCGSLDPGVLLYLLQHLQMKAQDISSLLYERSGLLGVSGISSDMQVLLDSADPHAAEAIGLFVFRIVGEIGRLAAVMGGVDAIVFSAGIGENSAPVRALICAGCAWLGASIDETANGVNLELIHAPDSKLQIAIVPTNEEKMIARHTQDWLAQGSSHTAAKR